MVPSPCGFIRRHRLSRLSTVGRGLLLLDRRELLVGLRNVRVIGVLLFLLERLRRSDLLCARLLACRQQFVKITAGLIRVLHQAVCKNRVGVSDHAVTATVLRRGMRRAKEFNAEEASMGRILIGLGVLLVFAGLLILGLEHIGFGPGRLPGDFTYRGRGVQVWFPLGTCILLSILLSLVLYLLSKFHR
jgi:hypothetical protein